MGLLGKIIKTGFNIVELPVAAVKDVITMGGVLEDQNSPYTAQKVRELGKTLKEVKDEASKL
ncbi:MAG: hypothetical protein BGO30_07360 [Bacteroidetes bacterium 41-46]|nr:MAG: hypothetical protein BGO30_07360 [Bacteroidetes bacterium 41-46]